MGRYVEQYVYDVAGNILSMRHRGSSPAHPGWTRTYQYEETSQLDPDHRSNRLSRTSDATYSVGGDGYDAHGNMLHMPQLQELEWNERDQLRMTRRQAVNGDDADGVYDSSGQRIRKVTELASGRVKDERLYLGGFEVHRVHGTSPLVRETLHVMDGSQRLALVETRTQGSEPNIADRVIRYQLGNHLSSASLELDEQARVLSYEEYTPFGSTSYQATSGQTEAPKRYRYAGKERDDETGLAYYGGRYGMSWLGRWASFDPALLVDADAASEDGQGEESGPGAQDGSGGSQQADGREDPRTARMGPMAHNGYCYALNNPIVLVDPDGWAPVPIGHVYVMRGTIAGEAVTYTGSTAQELMKRVGSRHKWNSLLKAEGTTLTAYEVRAELNISASERGTMLSARNEALRSAEQKILNQVQKEAAVALNEVRAATPENATTWRARHSVSLGRAKLTLRGGVRVGAFAGFALLDLFNMYRAEKMSRYEMAPYVLEDEGGQFTLSEEREHWFAHHYRWKNYIGGPKTGQKVEVDESEFDFWKREGELLWGTTDFWGDFVPGLLRPHLPVVEKPSHMGAYPEVI
jgi:RHS repeat-associated protein